MNAKRKSMILAPISLMSGFCNALIGAGGGIILSLALEMLDDIFPDKRDILTNSQASMIPACALSCFIFYAEGRLDTQGFSIYAIPAAAGGLLGSLLLSKINSRVIGMIFSFLIIWSGVRMIIF